MLILFETAAGYTLFKISSDVLNKALKKGGNDDIESFLEKAPSDSIKLEAFKKFSDTNEAVVAATALVESKLDPSLKKFLKKNIVKKEINDSLIVQDPKLGGAIRDALDIQCVGLNEGPAQGLVRAIRSHIATLLPGLSTKEDDEDVDNNDVEDALRSTKLGLAHTLSRYKLKFSPDKVDTMIVQAINLLDELDKEINIYAMRVKEWYGWHFPEMQKIIIDNLHYAKIVLRTKFRPSIKEFDLSDILGDETIEKELKETAEISMGTDISDEDISNISELCEQVISMTDYRSQLFDYLKNRMSAVAPNLTVLLGELVGARLIAHSGSLMNLAKAPASTVQILGAEKALFRAIKTKHNTPKHGLIFGCSIVGQSSTKNRGKISRVLASKAALAIRVDALGDEEGVSIGYECREKVEARLRQLETGEPYRLTGAAAKDKQLKKYSKQPGTSTTYNEAADIVPTSSKKREREEDDGENDNNNDDEIKKSKKKQKKDKKSKESQEEMEEEKPTEPEEMVEEVSKSSEKKKKKKKKSQSEESDD